MRQVREEPDMRRTGREGIYTRVVQDKPRKLESAADLLGRLGYEEPSEDQKQRNLEENLDYVFSQVGTK